MKLLKKNGKVSRYLIEIGEDYFYLGVLVFQDEKFILRNFKSVYSQKDFTPSSFWSLFEESFRNIYSVDIKKAYLIFSPKNFVSSAKLLPTIPRKEAVNYCHQVLVREMKIEEGNFYLDFRIKKLQAWDLITTMQVGIKKEVLDEILSILRIFNIEIERIDASVIAQEALFLGLGLAPKNEAVLALRLEEKFCELSILIDNYIVSYTVLDFGLKDIKSSLIRTLYTQTQPLEIKDEEAVKIMTEIGYTLEEGRYLGISYQQLRILLLPALEELSERINTFLHDFRKEHPTFKLSNIYLIGKANLVKGLGDFLESKFSSAHIKLEPISLSLIVKTDEKLSQENILESALLSAILYPPSKKYDFLPLHYKIIRETYRVKEKLLFYTLSLISLLGIFFLEIKLGIFYLDKIKISAQKVESELIPLVEKIKELNNFIQNVKKIEETIFAIYSQYPDWLGILKELSFLTPEEILIEEMKSQALETEKKLILKGSVITDISSSNLVLNKFVHCLEESTYFKNVKLTTSQVSLDYLNRIKFEMHCILK